MNARAPNSSACVARMPHAADWTPGRARDRGVAVLLVSVALLILGNTLHTTLLSLRAGIEQMSTAGIGLMMSAYFGGFACGSVALPRRIALVGHIRAYAAFASLVSAAILASVLVVRVPAWTLLRFVQGMCYAGMIVVIESWLNGCTENSRRGQILASYGLVFWGASAASQTLLLLAPAQSFTLFALASILVSIALAPVALAPSRAPTPPRPGGRTKRSIVSIAPLGSLSVFAGGICIGALWGMGPAYAGMIELGQREVSLFMTAGMAGALLLFWPLGRLADLIDRRRVIALCAAAGSALAFAIAARPPRPFSPLLALALLYGAMSIPLYALGVAHVNDSVDAADTIDAASALVLLQGAGAALGPALAGALMDHAGPRALFLFSGAVLATVAAAGAHIIARRTPAPRQSIYARIIPRISYVLHAGHVRQAKSKRAPEPRRASRP
jgi:MFS family permease